MVDQLPLPSLQYAEPDAVRKLEHGLCVSGYEGMGLLVAQHGMLPQTDQAPLEGEASSQQDDTMNSALLEFVLTQIQPRLNQVIRRGTDIPLANTIFNNGQRSTMFLTAWSRSSESAEYEMTRKSAVDHQLIELDFPPFQSGLYVPLISLTKQRTVASSMGNIVRQLDIEAGEEIPASRELEEAVTKYVERNSDTDGKVLIYALVSKRGHPSGSLDEPKEGEEAATFVRKALLDGSSLHRVISGGGGWGAKQGLLSLDPQPLLGEARSSPPAANDSDIAHMMTGLTSIAEKGAWIKFFVAYEPNLRHMWDAEAAGSRPDHRAGNPPQDAHVHSRAFGVVPVKSYDEPVQQEPDLPLSEVLHFPNHFGALSEQRMTLSSSCRTIDLMDEEKVVLGMEVRGSNHKTQLDVPYSSFEAYASPPTDKAGNG